jgi:CheY-like chemotaxis protein
MNQPLRILGIEDDPMDAVMVNHLLSRSGLSFVFTRVETEAAFRGELDRNPPDVILSDHGLPEFSGMAALAIAREQCPETPFILVTGRAERELALQAVTLGVMGCVSKDRLSELPALVRQAGEDARSRRRNRFWGRLRARLGRLFRR